MLVTNDCHLKSYILKFLKKDNYSCVFVRFVFVHFVIFDVYGILLFATSVFVSLPPPPHTDDFPPYKYVTITKKCRHLHFFSQNIW